MKSNFKFLGIITFLALFFNSCSNDDDINFEGDINPERFENVEVGNSDSKVPQFNTDLHTVFEYTGKTKVNKIYYDINPVSVSEPNTGEIKWQVSNYLIPEEYYEGQLNPHVHYHVFFDPINENFPETRPSKGTYSLKITVIEEDNSESTITKEFEVVKKFTAVQIGNDNKIELGSSELPTHFNYDAGSNFVSEIQYEIWFEEWREGQNVAIGSWDNIKMALPINLYENQNNPQIDYNMSINPDFPAGRYWLNIYVKESGEYEAIKLSVPFNITD